jgi:KRAB domain-containing zinc finger protein
MLENYNNFVSLGLAASKPYLIICLERRKETLNVKRQEIEARYLDGLHDGREY